MSLSAFLLGAALLLSPTHAQAAPPDLTGAGVITALKSNSSYSNRPYSETYNLGATGLRGWIYIDGNNAGDYGLITASSRQILVTVASAPASAVLAVDDVILGAMAGSSGTVPTFTSDCRKAFGVAIGNAEKTGAGTLRVKRWRAGSTTDVNIPMAIMGDYTATAPYGCPKSALVLANARIKLISELKTDPNFLNYGYGGAISGLALLASVSTGDADYAYVQTRLKSYADSLAANTLQPWGQEMWSWSYMSIFLSEYYLRTLADGVPDPSILAGISRYTVAMAKGQSRYGTFSHGVTPPKFDGSLHGTVTPYGPVNAAGIPGNVAIVMGKKALLAGGQAIDPEIDPAIQRGSDFFKYYVNKGSIPYGEHEPYSSGHASNGKDPMCAVLFGLQDNRPAETEYFARMSVAGCTGREYGHSGQGLSYLWGAMGANMGGPTAVAKYMENFRWHNDLVRRTDGSFSYDGQEQYGGGNTADGSYLGKCGYNDMKPTATYILSFGVSLQRLYITGRNAIPANTLSPAKVADAIAAATYKLDCPAFTTTQLLADLSAYDPVVRNSAATQLASRTLTTTELNSLIASITNGTMSSDPSTRMGACQALGARQAAGALVALGQRLSDTDLWVRGKAAQALRSYPAATASSQRDTMLAAFASNATDPDVIVWNDPVQIANNYLSFALFGDSVYGGGWNHIADYTINAPKNLLYPAVKAGLKQPDSNPRLGVADFARNYLTLADAQALTPDLFAAATTEALADTMWHGEARASGIQAVAKFKPAEAMSVALSMMEIPPGYGWGAGHFQIAALNVLNSFGDAARWTLPTLRQCLLTWDTTSPQYPVLITTIAGIEAAITAPSGIINLVAVAASQVVVTPVSTAKAITLTGTSPRGSLTYSNLTAPLNGTLTGTAPNLVYTPNAGYTGPDRFTFKVSDVLTTSEIGTVSIIVGSAGTGLKGEYFDNSNFTNLKLTRTDAQLDFDWGTNSPAPSIGVDTFSVRWSGLLLVPETGNYTFSTLNSDGVRLFINGIPVVDDNVDHSTGWRDSAPVALTAGQKVSLQMEYYENTGSAVAKLKWRGPSLAGVAGSIIAKEWLYDGTGITNQMAYAHPQTVSAMQNSAHAITLSGSGAAQTPLTYSVITQPAYGTLSGVAPNLIYTPAANYSGSDSFTFIVNNGYSNSAPGTVSIGIWSSASSSYYWTNAVTGDWSGAFWSNAVGGAVTPAASGNLSYILNFNKPGTYTTTQDLNANFAFNQINTASSVTIDGSRSLSPAANGKLLPQINQVTTNNVAFKTPINLTAMTTVSGIRGGSIHMTGIISGGGGLKKEGGGTLQLYGLSPNPYSGGTIINDGTLHLGLYDGTSPYCPNPVGTGQVTLNSGGTIQFDNVSANNPLIANGGTLYSSNGWGATWSGAITLNGNLTANSPFTINCSGPISGAGGFTKVGAGPLVLSGNNSFTGPNQITAGTLQCNSATSLGVGPLNINIDAKVNLNYSGTRTIAALSYNRGVPLLPGTYGSDTSPATNKNSTYFSGAGTITILPASNTSLALSGGITPSDLGAALTFTATVAGAVPSGNVAFYAGNTLLGTSALNGSFQASFTTSSLAVGSYNVTAKYAGNGSNSGSASAVLAINVINRFAIPPTNLFATTGNNRVSLTWTASGGATGYNVKRAMSLSGPFTTISSSSMARFDDVTAKNDITYYYVVSAINGMGESANSAPVSAKVDLSVTSGLVLRMDASRITGTSDGAQLNTWPDASGAANNAVRQSGSSTGYPKYVASGINGQPVVRFNSANPSAGDSFQFNRISTIRTVFWVLKEDPGLADGHFLLGDANVYDFHRGFAPNGPFWDPTYSSANIRNGITKLMGSTINGTTTSLPSGSFKLVSLETSGNVSANQICQDRTFHGSWQGDIAEILIYDRTLTSEEEHQVGTYLSNKYALQTSYNALPVSSGLVLRMDASKITGTADGAQLNTWTDTSGAANNAVRQSGSSTGYPKYVANGINGQPVVRFNSGNAVGDYFKFNRITDMRSVFWVLKENAASGDSRFLLGDDTSYQFHRGGNNGPIWDSFYADSNIKSGITKLMGNAINGTTNSLPSGSFQMLSLVTNGNVQANQICQDRTFHGSWLGDIAEILVYNRALSGPEEIAVGTYLATKYGLTSSYPASAILSPPSSVVATPLTSGAISVSWAPVSGAANYNVWKRNTQTNAIEVVSSSGSPLIVTGLSNGVAHEFKVSAINSSGVAGNYSSIATATPMMSAACDIASFVVPGQLNTIISGNTINVTVAAGTSVTALAPTYTVSPGASGNPTSGTTRNFSFPQTYTITAENGTTQKTYTVTVTSSTLTWNSGIDGSWSDGTKWTNGISPSNNGLASYVLNFNAAGTYISSNDMSIGFQLNRINFGGSAATLTGNALALVADGSTLPQLNQSSANPVTVLTNLILNANTSIAGSGGGGVTLAGVISGSGSLTKTTTGTLMLSGPSIYSGGTTVTAGEIHIGLNQNSALGSGSVTLTTATILRLNRVSMSNILSINSAKLSATNGFGDTWSGPISLSGTSTFDLETTGSLNVSGVITGSGALTKIGNGTTLTLSGTANTYSGGTIISGGTISCSSVGSLGQGSVAVASGGKLNLAFSGTSQVSTLSLGGAGQPSGTYGSTASSATYKNNTYFSGTGVLNVTSNLAGGMALSQSAPSMAAGSTDTPPPLPWVSGSIGSGMVSGSTSYNAGTVSQSGSGALGSTSDKLNFSYQMLSGDGEITAKISVLQDTGTLSGVGVMVRETLATNSKYVFMGMSGANTYRTSSRTTTGDIATSANIGIGTVPNTWVKLARAGNVITASKSTDGATWVSAGSTKVNMATSCYIGLAVSSGSDTTLNSSQFSNLTVTP